MKDSIRLLLVLLIIFFAIEFISKPFSHNSPLLPTPVPTSTILGSESAKLNNNSICHETGGLPDPNCTPGSIDTRVTQDNIYQTICKSGYTKTIRPPVSYTQMLKRQQLIEYGYTDTNMRDYEEDHLISLELGGNPTDPKNLWPEPGSSPNAKDSVENLCNKKVCSGEISLLEAQKEISVNWKTACQ